MGVSGDPLIHLSDMCRWSVCVKKLIPILPPALRHKFGLPPYSATTAGDSNSGTGELLLDSGNNGINVNQIRLGSGWM
jgi:hypothetical protein